MVLKVGRQIQHLLAFDASAFYCNEAYIRLSPQTTVKSKHKLNPESLMLFIVGGRVNATVFKLLQSGVNGWTDYQQLSHCSAEQYETP